MPDPWAGIDAALEALGARAPTLGAGRLAAVDGPAGSGKTTFAGALLDAARERGSRAELLRLDDMYDGWSGLNPELETRVLAQVLGPLARDRPARWQAYDWSAGRFGCWHLLDPPELLVLEGCGAGALTYAPYLTVLVWVEVPPDVRAARMVARDGDGVLAHLPAWTVAEQRHFAANRTSERADMRMSTPWTGPGPGG